MPAQLTLRDEIAEAPNFDDDLTRYIADLPPMYAEHEVVRRSSPRVPVPLAFYVDGVQYAKRSSITGFWLVNMVSQTRHLVLTLRKGSLCQCGCHGWCTLWVAFRFMHWMLESLAVGTHPSVRYDGTAFRPDEKNLIENAGKPGPLGAVVYVKADLAEFGTTLGFWGSASALFPCFLCEARKDNLLGLADWDAATPPFRARTWGDYNSACDRCEQWRFITRDQHLALRGLLFEDRRKTGRGLCLRADYPPLALLKDDRLEPWDGCMDIEQFEKLSQFPAKVMFWRRACEGFTHHRNPMFSESVGLFPGTSLALDWLHTLSLGIFQTWCSFALVKLFEEDAWCTASPNMDTRFLLSVTSMSTDLERWIRAQSREGRKLTEVGALKSEMFGTPSKPKFGFKAGETNAFLEYMVERLVPDKLGFLGSDARTIVDAGNCLFELLKLIRLYPKRFPVRAIEAYHRNAKTYLEKMELLLVNPKPKDHMLIEMANGIPFLGSPQLYANWQDEGLNRLLRDVASGAHSSVHDRRILVEFRKAHENDSRGRTTAKRQRIE